MTKPSKEGALAFETKTLDELVIEDERSFRHVALYADLKEILWRDGYTFRVLPKSLAGRWDRALFLNLTFWATGARGDVLETNRIPADVVAHAAWHHLAARALGPATAEAMFLGEAIASAFDLYLVGRLLGHAPESSFLETQVPAMAEVAQAAGLSASRFEALLAGVARDPDRAFEDLRALLVDATGALMASRSADDALAAFALFDAHRFGPLLHRYELSNWVLYARAYAAKPEGASAGAGPSDVDRALRRPEVVALDWLTESWVTPALADPAR